MIKSIRSLLSKLMKYEREINKVYYLFISRLQFTK